ncbi:MAG TPA: hypothetical protein VNG93_02325 [Candidatus Dormibacteraeota bacterium]|nr:hypothetical protein [Candidatus Dormibacteraeota bacterium]
MTRGRRRLLLLAFPLGVIAAILLWIGDMHLAHRDWLVGAPVFGLGMVPAFFAVRELRRAGLVK